MKKRSVSETVRLLCCSRPEFIKKSDGSLAVGRAARAMKLHQPTLKRILDGDSKTPREDAIVKLCAFFKVSVDQLLGRQPIPFIDGTGDEKHFIALVELLRGKSPDFHKEVLEYARFRSQQPKDDTEQN